MRSKVYLYLVILIFIFTRFLQISAKKSQIAYNRQIEVKMTLKEYPNECWYSADGFVFQINHCQQYQIGTKLLIFGKQRQTSANQSNSSIFLDVNEVSLDYAQIIWFYQPVQKAQQLLFQFRLDIYSRMKQILLEPEASLFFSLIFGGKSFLSAELEEKITLAGGNHLIAASGMNVSLLVLLINRCFIFASRKTRTLLMLMLIFVYVHLAGLSVSIIRAGLMGTFSLLNGLFLRKNSLIWNLFLTAAILLGINPALILDISFQLSFVAVLSILSTQGIFKQLDQGWFANLQTAELLPLLNQGTVSPLRSLVDSLKDSFFISLVVNLWLWPIMAYHFGQVNLVGLVSTLFLSWLLLPIFVLGSCLIVLALLIPQESVFSICLLVLSFPLHYLIKLFLLIIDFFSHFGILNLVVELKSWLWLSSWYLLLVVLLVLAKKLKARHDHQSLLTKYETVAFN